LKKQSGRKGSSPPHNARTIFVDRSLGSKKIPDGLRGLGVPVEIHDDHFARDADDTLWLNACGTRAWIVLTKDERIRRDPAEVAAVVASGVDAIFIGRQDINADEMLADLARALGGILRRLTAGTRPQYFIVHRGGRVDSLRLVRSKFGVLQFMNRRM
jgi:uncharacterized protein with PIN domain